MISLTVLRRSSTHQRVPLSLETMDGGYIGGRQTTQEFVPIEERGIPRAMVTDRSVRKL